MPAATSRIALPDRYRVVAHIANGGMAGVWAAEDAILGRVVAVKVLAPGYAADAAARRRFQREARAGARLSDHPNVVTVFDVGECEGVPYMVMEHFAGGSVADRVRRGEPVPRTPALRWLADAAAALDHAHRLDVVHRDVKPGNLLLDERDRCAVGDFGIALVATETSMTQTGQVLGTAAYISPEQAVGEAATPASDRYALGVVAWELLTGHRPFPGATPAAQARAHVEADVPPASRAATGLPAGVDAVLRSALAKDPADRPPTAHAFVGRLEAALGDAGPATDATRPLAAAGRAAGRPRTPSARRGPLLAALAAAVLVLGAVGAYLALGRDGGGAGGSSAAAQRRDRGSSSSRASRGSSGSSGSSGAGASKGSRAKRSPSATGSTGSPATGGSSGSSGSSTPPATPAQPAPKAKDQAAGSGTTDPAQLNDQGYARLQAGDATGALPLLQRSVFTYRANDRSTGLPYVFALYNLARALRLTGQPVAAVPYLEERLRVSDNQRGVVERELAAARKQAGG